MPKVSIVIPVYNAQDFICETLDSVQKQTFIDFECVIVNDGSTDNSLNLIERYVQSDSRFKCITVTNNGCANIPRNIAIRNSIGDFVFNLDADDKIDAECIEKMILRQEQISADIILLRMIGCMTGLIGEAWRLPLNDFDMNQVLCGEEACKLTIGRWQLPCNGMLVRRELFEGVPEGRYFISDEVASRHLLYKAEKVGFADVHYYYRNNNESITRAVTPKIFDRLMTDELLDFFISEHYKMDDSCYRNFRNTRLLNMIYLRYDFFKYRKQFDKLTISKIKRNFRQVFYSQKLNLLQSELPFFFGMLFVRNYALFQVSSLCYVAIKDRNGRNYQMK